MEYWINIYDHKDDPISCLAEDPHMSQEDAIDHLDGLYTDWEYLHTLHFINGVCCMTDLMPLLREGEHAAKLDAENEVIELSVLRASQFTPRGLG